MPYHGTRKIREVSIMEYKKTFKVSEITTLYKPTKNSHKEILKMVSKRRPYRPSDFKKQFFIPDLK